MVNRIVVGAHYGLRDWVLQRITAMVMAVYTPLFAVAVMMASPLSEQSWRGIFAQGWMKFASFLFFVSLCYHAWIGLRDIFMDYIKPVGLRLTLHAVAGLLLVGYAGWAANILWRL